MTGDRRRGYQTGDRRRRNNRRLGTGNRDEETEDRRPGTGIRLVVRRPSSVCPRRSSVARLRSSFVGLQSSVSRLLSPAQPLPLP